MPENNDVIEFYLDEHGEYRWRRVDPDNRRILSVPGEGFTKKAHAFDSARRTNSDIPESRFEDLTEMATD